MTGLIFRLSLRQLVFRRSTLLLALLALVPLLLAIVFQLSEPDVEADRWTARTLYIALVITAVLPLTALLLGASTLGDEMEDGTAVYLLTKPIPRWQILMPKLIAAWLITTVLVLPTAVAAGLIALDGEGETSLVVGFGVAIVIGGLAYSTIFVLLSVITSRALITGLVYAFFWEGAITSIFPGARYLSVRHYSLGIADWISNPPERVFDAYVNGVTALVLVVLVTAVAVVIANQQLEEIEVREPS
jgi:ABC-2 type transport system permease protein